MPAAQAQESASGMSKTSAGTTAMDTTFMKKAARGGMAEVELGQLAVQKGTSDDVKKFGQRMVDDHSKANDQLKQIASEEHVALPQSLSAKDKATKSSLEQLSGSEFDRAYMRDMVTDHKQDVAEFQKESKSAHDPSVKNFAAQTLPTLMDHLKDAQRIASSQGASASSR
jgi:putative membrane protein